MDAYIHQPIHVLVHACIYTFIHSFIHHHLFLLQERKFERAVSFTTQHEKKKNSNIYYFLLIFSFRALKIHNRFIDKNQWND